MTLLSIVQNAATELNIGTPSFVMAAVDSLGLQLKQIANRSGQVLLRRHPYAALQREALVTLVNGQASYSLPSDFNRFIDRTQWDRNNHWELMGPMTPQEWQWRKSGIVTTSPRRRFRIKPDAVTKKLFFDPTPAAGDDGLVMAFEYVSDGWILSSDGFTRLNAWASDTDTSLLDNQLIELAIIWRFLRAKGLSYDEEKEAYEAYADSVFVQELGSKTHSLGSRASPDFDGLYSPYWNIPEGNYG